MPVEHHTIPRIQLPRSLVGRRTIRTYIATWKFEIGQQVVFGGAAATVIERSRSAMGIEIYTIVTSDIVRPVRTVRGGALEHFH